MIMKVHDIIIKKTKENTIKVSYANFDNSIACIENSYIIII